MSLAFSKKAAAVKPSSTLAITAKAKKLKSKGVDVVGFGAGEPDFDTPQNIKDAAILAIQEGFTKYTAASGTDELKLAICDKLKKCNGLTYEKSQIVISNGGKHALTNAFTAIINPGNEVIVPEPYWLSYPEIIKLAGGVPIYVKCKKENGYKLTPEELRNECNEKTKAVVLNSPNNPTGAVYSEKELRALAQVVLEKNMYVISDEIYEHLIYGEKKHISIASLGEEIHNRTIICNGMSKSYSMTGWRIGYTASSKEIAKLMGSVQSHQTSNPNSIAQKAAQAALEGPQESVEMMRQEFDRRRRYMYDRIAAMPYISAQMPEGAFYFFLDVSEVLKMEYKFEEIETAEKMASILIEDYNVAVVPCMDFGFDDHIRLSYAISIEQIEKGLDRIEKFLKQL